MGQQRMNDIDNLNTDSGIHHNYAQPMRRELIRELHYWFKVMVEADTDLPSITQLNKDKLNEYRAGHLKNLEYYLTLDNRELHNATKWLTDWTELYQLCFEGRSTDMERSDFKIKT